MTRRAFFDAIRPMFGRGLDPVQVQVIEAILDATQAWPREHVAFTLATAYGEAKCIPRRENMNYTAARIRSVWPKRPEAVKFAGQPVALANSVYGGRLGNRAGTNDGWVYRGGGVDQLTGRFNYQAVGLAGDPEAILQPAKAVKSLIHGVSTGRYRGFKLTDFDGPRGFNYVSARGIINDDVKRSGETYAGYARKFEAALKLIGPRAPIVDHVPVTAAPSFWAGLLKSLAAFFQRET